MMMLGILYSNSYCFLFIIVAVAVTATTSEIANTTNNVTTVAENVFIIEIGHTKVAAGIGKDGKVRKHSKEFNYTHENNIMFR